MRRDKPKTIEVMPPINYQSKEDFSKEAGRPRRFTTRPVWRDWLLGAVLLGIGFSIISSMNDRPTKVFSYLMMTLGGVMLAGALIHGLGVMFGLWERDDIR